MSGIFVLALLTVILPIAMSIYRRKQRIDRKREADLHRLSGVLKFTVVDLGVVEGRGNRYDALRGEAEGLPYAQPADWMTVCRRMSLALVGNAGETKRVVLS